MLLSVFTRCFFLFSDSDMPDHDLEPPRFAQLALERVLQDWNALKSMIMFGSQENKDPYVFIIIFLDLFISHVSVGNYSAFCLSFPLKTQCQQQDRPSFTRRASIPQSAKWHHSVGLFHSLPYSQMYSRYFGKSFEWLLTST